MQKKIIMFLALTLTSITTQLLANSTISISNHITSGAPDKRNKVFIDYLVAYLDLGAFCKNDRVPVAKNATESREINACGGRITVEFPDGSEAQMSFHNGQDVTLKAYGSAGSYYLESYKGAAKFERSSSEKIPARF